LPNATGSGPAITIAFCWSHLRREFYDLAKDGAPIAMETLSRIAALYQIEAGIRGESAERRRTVRKVESRPLVENLHTWFTEQLAKLSGRSPTAGAIRYAMTHWHGLVRFLEDGRIELDTNPIERAMRPVTKVASVGPAWPRSSRPAS
jgi:transposase